MFTYILYNLIRKLSEKDYKILETYNLQRYWESLLKFIMEN